jgi:acyl-CoA hydrolase
MSRARRAGVAVWSAILMLSGCADRTPPDAAPALPPAAEFLVAAGDSTYWVRADAQGMRVRSAPLLLARHDQRFHELRIADAITDFVDAEFVQEALYARPLDAADSVLLYADGAVAEAMTAWQRANPGEAPIDIEEEDAPEPESVASDFLEVIDVHGRWVSWAHALDLDVVGADDHLHRRRRGVTDLVTGRRASLDSLMSPAEAARVRHVGQSSLDTMRAVIERASDERARLAQATLHTFVFVDSSFSITDVDQVPAIVFHVAGTSREGEALELLLPPIPLLETPAWWAEVTGTLPRWDADSSGVQWRHGEFTVVGTVDSARTSLRLSLTTGGAAPAEWPIAVVPMPAYQFMVLDPATFGPEARASLLQAFDRAAGDDPYSTRASLPRPGSSRLPSRFAMTTRPARHVSESSHVSSELIMPQDANILGHVFGGAIMAMVDKAAAVAAFRHARTNCVTASIDRVDFKEPIHVGELVSCHASVNFVGTTSMEVGVRVEAEDLISGIRRHTNTCYLTFVAIDRNGRPVPIPQVIPDTPEQERRYAAAQERRRRRLEERQAEARTAT